MGLDMYLKAQRYVNKHDYSKSDTDEPVVTQEFKDVLKLFPELDTGNIYGFEVGRTIAYWRKANQIHQWFVINCQSGEDDCKQYYVEREQLQELLDLCHEVKKHKDDKEFIEEELPPQAGFFFGSTEIDDCYWQDIDSTIDQLTKILNDERLNNYDFYYQSSW